MFATLTSKGQLTLPKEIRDRLNLDAGAILDFQIQADHTITARHVQPDARRIQGLLKPPPAAPLTVEQMDAAVSKHLRDKQADRPQIDWPMMGIDTNILLRLWLNDDPVQSKCIDRLPAEHGTRPGSLMVTDVVLVEAVWTLKSAFEQDKHAQLIAVRSLLEAGSCGFADRLVVAKHARQACDFTASFERCKRKLPGAKAAP